jgi:signal transduction histidine kinase/DNA-binding response OmpR family regulator
MNILRVLLLEDSVLDTELIQSTLAESEIHCELIRVETRADFIAALQQQSVDLILADYSLPTFDGGSALQIARTTCPEVPFIFISGAIGEELAIETLKSGATDYVLKQRLERLAPSVRRALREAEDRLKRQQAEESLYQQSERLHILAEVSQAFAETILDFESVLDTIVRRCAELLGDVCAIRLLSEDGRWLNPVAMYHTNPDAQVFVQAVLNTKQRSHEGLHAQVLQTGQVLLIPSVSVDELEAATSPKLRSFLSRFTISSILISPLRVRGRVIGTLEMVREQPNHPFTPEEQDLLQSLADRAALSIDNARLYQESQQANRVKDQFLAVLSHELRSPLNPILGWTKLLRSRQFDEATTKHALEIIERNAKLQTQLIDDLLDVSRIMQGKLNLNVCSINLADVIKASLETVRLAADAKTIKLHTLFDPNVGVVAGDAGRLQQIVGNLLSNAVKFTGSGGRVEVRLEQVDAQAQITVVDTGKGIQPHLLPHIFNYFWQADSSTTRSFGGLGLGLAVVRHLVELHGGTVWADSPGEDQGATFTVRLPLIAASPEAKPIDEKPTQSVNLDGVHVLVVDDETDMRELIDFILKPTGAKVTVVSSAEEALSAIAQHEPNILVSDIGMPDVDGYMLLQQIRTLNPTERSQVPAIALTAYAGEMDQQQALSAGFQKHIAKPVEPEALITAIAELTDLALHH